MAKKPRMLFVRKPLSFSELTSDSLYRLALHYVSRFATSTTRLTHYLEQKVKQRGWHESSTPPIEHIVSRMVSMGYVNDQLYFQAQVRALERRGFGPRRIQEKLKAVGASDETAQEVYTKCQFSVLESAIRYARKSRLGPFCLKQTDPKTRHKHLACLLRAGHDMDTARLVLQAQSPQELEQELQKKASEP